MDNIIQFFVDLVQGMQTMRSVKVFHGDIKWENAFVVGSKEGLYHIKLGDFGSSGFEGKVSFEKLLQMRKQYVQNN